MRKIPRERERTASPAELEDERQRWVRATTPPAPEGNLCACLVTLAAYRQCSCCRAPVIFVNEQARTDGDVVCGRCEKRREDLGKQCRKPAAKGCPHCGSLATFLDGPIAQPMISCGGCGRSWPALPPKSRPSLPVRVALHLHALFGLANDNHEVSA